MSNFIDTLNLTTDLQNIPERAIVIDTKEDTSICDALRAYCIENGVDLDNVTEHELFVACDLIEDYKNGSANEHEFIAFWID